MNSFVRSCKKTKAAVLQRLLRINMNNLMIRSLLSAHTLNLVGLASAAGTMVLAADTEAGDPAKQRDEHKCSGSPCQSKELAAPVGVQPNVIAVLVNNISPFDSNGCDEGAREADSQEGECRKKEVDTGSKSAVPDEDSKNAGEKRDEDEADCNDVEHEHGCHERIEGIDSVLDVIWPV